MFAWLKIGITLLSHLNTVSTNGSTDTPIADVVDLDSCPVFKNGPLSVFIAHQVTFMAFLLISLTILLDEKKYFQS